VESPSDINDEEQLRFKTPPLKPQSAYLEKALITLVIVGVIFAMYWAMKSLGFSPQTDAQSKVDELISANTNYKIDQYKGAVVNVICPEANTPFNLENEQNQGASGFVLNKEGRIITNYHLFTTDEDPKQTMPIHERGCLVLFPDEATGFSGVTYVAKPVFYPRLSYDYDLAFLDIYDAYDGEIMPDEFQALELVFCQTDEIELGDKVLSLGYPAATDGYTLTLADGIVSAFTNYESIYSTASLGAGGSGGPVISEKGCLAGVYAGVVYDDFTYYGEIYTAQSIADFIKQSKSIDIKQEKEGQLNTST